MKSYEEFAAAEIMKWKRQLNRRASLINRMTKKAQDRITSAIPERVHNVITETIKKVVQAALLGSEYTTSVKQIHDKSLQKRDQMLQETLSRYRKIAAAEGAGTGAGGILLGIADFPLLISIKMKFLFEAASIYGFDVRIYEERVFILYVFQLAFSSERYRKSTLSIVEFWEDRKQDIYDIDWRLMQQEYRDHIDFIKMLQLIPGLGAIVGAYANYSLLDQLGETAMNAYRMRILYQRGERLTDE